MLESIKGVIGLKTDVFYKVDSFTVYFEKNPVLSIFNNKALYINIIFFALIKHIVF